eukprot:2142817-Prymnesium_polylepis.2
MIAQPPHSFARGEAASGAGDGESPAVSACQRKLYVSAHMYALCLLSAACHTRHGCNAAAEKQRANSLLGSRVPLSATRYPAVATLDILPVIDVARAAAALRRHIVEQRLDHLARVARMHAVILRRCGEQHPRAPRPAVLRAGALAQPLVGRYGRQVALPDALLLGVAVLLHPARTGEQLVVACHVQQRHLAHGGAKGCTALPRQHIAHE